MDFEKIIAAFKKIRTATIEKNNQVVPFVLFIILVTPLILFIVFLTLYLLSVPMENHGVVLRPGETGYDSFFLGFLIITGGIILVLLILILILSKTIGISTIYLSETVNLDKVIYIVSKSKEVYLTDKIMYTYNTKNQTVYTEKNTQRLKEEIEKTLFWFQLKAEDNIRIKSKKNVTSIRITSQVRKSKLTKFYSVYFDDSERIIKFTEIISTSTYGNNNFQSYSKFNFIDINGSSFIHIHPLIQNEIAKSL
ncbi:MAG: hypothetical protein PHC62_01370 [Candidatus Izemoplasmatales bacterium]|jgi:hypothetical protein|nr:hypothetical protein [Candidatus Izemoplasmatales bacterium]